MRRPLLILLALAIGAAALAALAPAELVGMRVDRLSGGTLALAQTEGTIWRGRGILVANGGARLPLAWSLDPWPLLRGAVRLRVAPYDSAGTTPRGEIAVHDGTVALSGIDVALPAAMLTAAGPRASFQAGGEVRVTSRAFDWSPPASRGDARVAWTHARLVQDSGEALDLGTVTAVLTADGVRVAGPVANEGGDLAVRGEVVLRPRDGIQLSLTLTPRRADNATLPRSLAAIGTPDGAGWRVEWHGFR